MRKIHRAIFWFYNIEQNIVKNRKQYLCETCDYSTSNVFDFNKHNTTRKHLVNKESNQNEPENRKKSQQHICDNCSKLYASKSGLWNHKKKCSQKSDKDPCQGGTC